MKKLLMISVLTWFSCQMSVYAQNEDIDAYKKKIGTVKADSTLAKMYNALSWKLVSAGYDKEAFEASKKAEGILVGLPDAIKRMNSAQITDGYIHMGFGIIYKARRDFSKALKEFNKGLEIMKSVSDYDGVSRMYVNISGLFIEMGKYPEALKYQLDNLELKQKAGDKSGEYRQLGEIGVIYLYSHQHDKALEYFLKSAKGAEEIGDSSTFAAALGDLGNIYQLMGKYDEACDYYNKGLRMDSLIGNVDGLMYGLLNTGLLYMSRREPERSSKLLLGALDLFQQTNNSKGVSAAKMGLANVASMNKDFVKARQLAQEALTEAQKAKSNEYLRDCYKVLSDVDSARADYKSALYNYKMSVKFSDSLVNERNMVDIARSEMKYDFHQKEEVARIEQERKELLEREERSRQAIIRNAFIGGFILFFILALVMYRGYLNKKKANEIISRQKEEVSRQNELLATKNHIIEEKQKEILDSIHYAKRIQTSLMPREKYVDKSLKRLWP